MVSVTIKGKQICPNLLYLAKKEMGSPNEGWDIDQQIISKLKEEYKKERKGKKTSKFIFFEDPFPQNNTESNTSRSVLVKANIDKGQNFC